MTCFYFLPLRDTFILRDNARSVDGIVYV